MAKPFGQADIGLIKATAGAEASQFMDTGLMTASVIGGVLDKVNARNALIAKQNATIEKEMSGKLTFPSGQLSTKMQEYVLNTTMKDKSLYASYLGSDVSSKIGREQVMQNNKLTMDQMSVAAGVIETHLAKNAQYGAGMSAQDKVYGNMMTTHDYVIEGQMGLDGNPQVMFGFEKVQKPIFDIEIEGLVNAEKNEKEKKIDPTTKKVFTLDDKQRSTLQAYRDSVIDWEEHSQLDDTVDGKKNPDKYDFFDVYNLPGKGTNIEIETKNLTTWNTYHDNKSDKDYEWNPGAHKGDAENYSKELQTSLKGTNTKDLRDMGNSDWSNDGIDNSFNSIFTDGANLEKHPNMYQNDDGTGINVTFRDPNDPAPEMTLVYDAKTNTFKQAGEIIDISEPQKKQILNDYLRDISETEPELYTKKYADFMGVVSADAYEIEQKAHFEAQNKYFNTGVEGDNPIYDDADSKFSIKFETYVNTKLEAALPMDVILGVGGFSEEGQVAKALAAEFPPESGVVFELDDETKKMNVKVGGTNMDFDFSKDPDLEYKRLQDFLYEGIDDEAINRFNDGAKNLSNDARDDDWGKISDNQYKHHSYPRTKHVKSMNEYIRKYPDTNVYEIKGPDGQILDSKNVKVIDGGNNIFTILYNGNVMKNVHIKTKPTTPSE